MLAVHLVSPPPNKYKGRIQVGLYLYCLCFFFVQLRVARCAGSCAASTAGHSQTSNFIPQHNTAHTHLFFFSCYITKHFFRRGWQKPTSQSPLFLICSVHHPALSLLSPSQILASCLLPSCTQPGHAEQAPHGPVVYLNTFNVKFALI